MTYEDIAIQGPFEIVPMSEVVALGFVFCGEQRVALQVRESAEGGNRWHVGVKGTDIHDSPDEPIPRSVWRHPSISPERGSRIITVSIDPDAILIDRSYVRHYLRCEPWWAQIVSWREAQELKAIGGFV